MSNYTRKFQRHYARENGLLWSRRRHHHRARDTEQPMNVQIIHDDRIGRRKARQGGVIGALLSIAAAIGFARRRT